MNATYWWNLAWQIHLLGNCLLSTQWTILVHVLHLLAEIGRLANQGNDTVFDRQIDVCAFLNFLSEIALGFYCESFAAAREDLALGLVREVWPHRRLTVMVGSVSGLPC